MIHFIRIALLKQILKVRRHKVKYSRKIKSPTVRHGVVDENCGFPGFSQDAVHRHAKNQLKALGPLQLWLTQVVQNRDPERLHADARGEVQVTTDAHVVNTG